MPSTMFQHTAARRRLGRAADCCISYLLFQHTAARRRLVMLTKCVQQINGFNTQPPEGGWRWKSIFKTLIICFNTQPPEGGWGNAGTQGLSVIVSTHSRPKAAGPSPLACEQAAKFQHTAARRRLENVKLSIQYKKSFNTQPPEGGWAHNAQVLYKHLMFQHTAARRRLAVFYRVVCLYSFCFNTQPPEGGWPFENTFWPLVLQFQHTAARRRLVDRLTTVERGVVFQHTAARRRLASLRLCCSFFTCFNTQPPEGGWSLS